jgi:hypothetical protein
MNEDNILLLFSFILFWVTLLLFFIRSKGFKGVSYIHLVIHCLYSSYFVHGLWYRSENGTALAWWFYLLCLIWGHWLIIILQMIVLSLRKQKDQR